MSVNTLLKRNLAFERHTVRKAAKGLVDPDPLLHLAHLRAERLSGEYVTDPLIIKRGLDRPGETCEEAVDAVNHLLFHMQEFPNDPRNDEYLIAMRFFLLAFDRIRSARD